MALLFQVLHVFVFLINANKGKEKSTIKMFPIKKMIEMVKMLLSINA